MVSYISISCFDFDIKIIIKFYEVIAIRSVTGRCFKLDFDSYIYCLLYIFEFKYIFYILALRRKSFNNWFESWKTLF